MNIPVETIRVYDKGCIGCKDHGAELMVSYQETFGGPITDLFLNAKQAKSLSVELAQCMARNAEQGHPEK